MWGAGLFKVICGGGTVGLIALIVNVSANSPAQAGNRLYDMDRLLSQPHPYHHRQSNPPAAGVRRPELGAVTKPSRQHRAPLPGSQYRISGAPKTIPRETPYTGGRLAGYRASPAAAASGTERRGFLRERGTEISAGNRSFVSEIVLGGWLHDPGRDNTESNTWDMNLEIIFRKVTLLTFENRYLRFLFSPHPMLGGSLNNENETHTAYLGFNWHHQFESRLFVAGSFGFAYHTGNIDRAERSCVLGDSCLLPGNRSHFDNGEVVLGSRILFRESLEIGYRVAQRHGISVYVAHMSNASLFDEDNDGMNFVGLRYRYAFD